MFLPHTEWETRARQKSEYDYNYMHAVYRHNLVLFLSVLNCVPTREQKDGIETYL